MDTRGAVLLGDPGKDKVRASNGGVLLDKNGKFEFVDDKYNKPGVLFATGDDHFDLEQAAFMHQISRGPDLDVPEIIRKKAPPHVLKNLAKARSWKHNLDDIPEFQPIASNQKWGEGIGKRNNDGTAVTAASTETIMLPIFTLPADYCEAGRWFRWTVFGRQSTAITTPGTITFKLSYSASGTGSVTVASSGAFAPDPTAAATNLTFMLQWWAWVRTDGATGTMMAIGQISWSDFDDASAATIVGNLNMNLAPPSAPATATIDTTQARALSPTYTSSVSTASMTAHGGILESLT